MTHKRNSNYEKKTERTKQYFSLSHTITDKKWDICEQIHVFILLYKTLRNLNYGWRNTSKLYTLYPEDLSLSYPELPLSSSGKVDFCFSRSLSNCVFGNNKFLKAASWMKKSRSQWGRFLPFDADLLQRTKLPFEVTNKTYSGFLRVYDQENTKKI